MKSDEFIQMKYLNFFKLILNNDTTPIVTLEDGTEALRVAYMIIDSMESR